MQQLFEEVGRHTNPTTSRYAHGYLSWSKKVTELMKDYQITFPINPDQVSKRIDDYASEKKIPTSLDTLVDAKAFFKLYFTNLSYWLGKQLALDQFKELNKLQSELESELKRVNELSEQVVLKNPVNDNDNFVYRSQLFSQLRAMDEMNRNNQDVPNDADDKAFEEQSDLEPVNLIKEITQLKQKYSDLMKEKQSSVEHRSDRVALAFFEKFQPQIEKELGEAKILYDSAKMKDLDDLGKYGTNRLNKYVEKSEQVMATARKLFEVKPSGDPARFIDMLWKEAEPEKKPNRLTTEEDSQTVCTGSIENVIVTPDFTLFQIGSQEVKQSHSSINTASSSRDIILDSEAYETKDNGDSENKDDEMKTDDNGK